jgi:hypothetical protein
MRKNKRKLKATKKKVNNTIKKGGGSLIHQERHQGRGMTPKEAEKMRKSTRKLKSTRKKIINNIVTKKQGGVQFIKNDTKGEEPY